MDDEKIIEVKFLSKQFKDVKAVNGLNINVYKGDVFGFLGPNGAGKSTTIRMLLSLISPAEGKIKIFGKELNRHRKEILGKIGAIVEKPDFYGYLPAYKNLEILGKISGKEISKKRIMEVLAQALLHDPELIILDEPTTGLDPQGMKEIRDLIVYLSKEKQKTIFLSSHILYEVELVASRMIIINKGTAIVEGKVEDLLNSKNLKVTFEVDNPDAAKSLLNSTAWAGKLETSVNGKLIFSLEPGEIAHLNKYFVQNNIEVSAVVPTRSLEEYFLNITQKES